MATVLPIITTIVGQTNLDGWQVVWPAMKNGDVGAAVGSTISGTTGGAASPAPGGGFMSGFCDKSIQAVGTFGTGGSVACEGSNDAGANWLALNDPFGNVIAITAAAMKEITEAVIWIRPHVTAGDGTTSLNVTMFFRKTQSP